MPSPTPTRLTARFCFHSEPRDLIPIALSLSQALPLLPASPGQKLPIPQQSGLCLSYLTRAYVSSSSAAIQAMSAKVGTGGTSLRHRSETLGRVYRDAKFTNKHDEAINLGKIHRRTPNSALGCQKGFLDPSMPTVCSFRGWRGGFQVGNSLNKRPEAKVCGITNSFAWLKQRMGVRRL